jgi:hypothetical protein
MWFSALLCNQLVESALPNSRRDSHHQCLRLSAAQNLAGRPLDKRSAVDLSARTLREKVNHEML